MFLDLDRTGEGREVDRHAIKSAFLRRSTTFRCGLRGGFLRLDPLPHAVHCARGLGLFIAENMRVASDHLPRDGISDRREVEFSRFFSHLRVKDDLKQQIAQLVLEVVKIAARDRIGDLIGFLDGIGRNAGEVLLDVPGTAMLSVPQHRHQQDQIGNGQRFAARGFGVQLGDGFGDAPARAVTGFETVLRHACSRK